MKIGAQKCLYFHCMQLGKMAISFAATEHAQANKEMLLKA
jgi:hypothetical protein